MGIDINKIITESIQDIREGDEVTEDENQDVVTESADVQESQDQVNYQNDVNKESNIMETAVASAISAGLGAMTFRRHFKNIQEGKIGNAAKKIGKYGSVAAGAGGLGYLAANPDEASEAWDGVKKAVSSKTAEAGEKAGEAWDGVKKAVSSKTAEAGEKASEAGEKASEAGETAQTGIVGNIGGESTADAGKKAVDAANKMKNK